MQKDIHPAYREVVFQDITTGKNFLTHSTADSAATIELDGKTYPLIKVDVTSDSHPFWTGARTTMDTEGRVAAFHRRYAKKVK